MEPAMRRLLVFTTLIMLFGFGMTVMLERAKANPMLIPQESDNRPKPTTTTDNQSKGELKNDSKAYDAGKETRDTLNKVGEKSKDVAKDVGVVVTETAKQVGEAAQQVGQAASQATADASKTIGEFIDGFTNAEGKPPEGKLDEQPVEKTAEKPVEKTVEQPTDAVKSDTP